MSKTPYNIKDIVSCSFYDQEKNIQNCDINMCNGIDCKSMQKVMPALKQISTAKSGGKNIPIFNQIYIAPGKSVDDIIKPMIDEGYAISLSTDKSKVSGILLQNNNVTVLSADYAKDPKTGSAMYVDNKMMIN